MTITLLIDLDDTLLTNPLDKFLPAYLHKLSAHLASYADPALLVQALMAGTRQMMQNRLPDCSLSDVFGSVFYPLIKVQQAEIQPAIDEFYVRVFPSLQALSKPRPEAVQLVESAFERGYQIAIATAPLFPRTAIEQRLEWAGLSPQKYPFSLVTSFDTFHFSKPDPAYLAEILARIGWPEGPVVMVGNDLDDDIEPASQLEIASYWVSNGGGFLMEKPVKPTAVGNLDGILPWIDQTDPDALQPRYSEPAALLAVLRSTPAALNSLCYDLTPTDWHARPRQGEWSPTEILCHLRDVDTDINLPRLKKVIQNENPFLPGIDSDQWAVEREYAAQDGMRALQRFSASRQRTLYMLEKLSREGWERKARHAIFGPTQVKELVAIMAAHDRVHVRQIVERLKIR